MLANVSRRLGFAEVSQPARLVLLGGFFAAFAIVDRLTRAVVGLDAADVDGPVLIVRSVRSNWQAAVLIVVTIAVLIALGGARLLCRWSDLEHGATLRLLASPLIVLLTWQGAFYQYNYLADRTHLLDRWLLFALGIGALIRPAFIVGFVLQTRVIAEQFGLPFGTEAAQNLDELLVIVLIAISVAHLAYSVLDSDDTSPVIVLSAAAIATHFFIPGRGKVLLNWVAHEDLSNLASSGYAVGWLGQTDGGLARWMVDAISSIGLPLRLLTLVLEIGVLIAVVNHRWFRAWLPLAVAFHIANFVLLGFSFLSWMILEILIVIILSRAELREWLDRSLTLGQAAMTAVVVAVLGPFLFHPPGLAWFDSPVAYGYEIEVDGRSGRTYNLPIASFAPFDQDLAFNRLQLGDTHPVTGAYGVVISPERLHQLEGLTDVAEVIALEAPVDVEDDLRRQEAEQFLIDFVDYANRRADGQIPIAGFLAAVEPLPKYWTGRPAPNYEFQEPVANLTVHRVANLRTADGFQRARTEVFSADWD